MRERPVFLDLRKIALPLPALISILHRVTGVVFFIGLPILLYAYYMLSIGHLALFQSIWFRLMLWGMISGFVYHMLAGLRHMWFDFFHIHLLSVARISSWLVLGLSVILSIWSGLLLFRNIL